MVPKFRWLWLPLRIILGTKPVCTVALLALVLFPKGNNLVQRRFLSAIHAPKRAEFWRAQLGAYPSNFKIKKYLPCERQHSRTKTSHTIVMPGSAMTGKHWEDNWKFHSGTYPHTEWKTAEDTFCGAGSRRPHEKLLHQTSRWHCASALACDHLMICF